MIENTETEDFKPVATVWLQIFLSLFPRSKSAVTAVSNLAHSDSPWNADASSEMNQAPIAASLSSDLGSLKKKKKILFPLQRLGWTVVTIRLRRTAVSLVSPFYPPSLSFCPPLTSVSPPPSSLLKIQSASQTHHLQERIQGNKV